MRFLTIFCQIRSLNYGWPMKNGPNMVSTDIMVIPPRNTMRHWESMAPAPFIGLLSGSLKKKRKEKKNFSESC